MANEAYEPESLAGVTPARPFCGVRQSVIEEARRRQFQWVNKRKLNWCIADRIPGVALDALTSIYAQAWAAWQAVCGLTFTQVQSAANADLIILTRPIDGSGGTLAEHELPMGNDRPLRGWFDTREVWHVGEAPPPAGKIDLLAVATHEFGHGIGLSHEETRGTVALLDPFYNPQIRTPQAWDIAEAQKRYGPPVEEPKPVEPTDPNVINGVIEIVGHGVFVITGERKL